MSMSSPIGHVRLTRACVALIYCSTITISIRTLEKHVKNFRCNEMNMGTNFWIRSLLNSCFALERGASAAHG
jgi:hypothetical protein